MDNIYRTEEATETEPRKERKRQVGLAVIRGTSLVVINPVDGYVMRQDVLRECRPALG